jgi:hypothetical protein
MLGPWQDREEDPIAVLPPSTAVASMNQVAANAVMAGCRPEYFPVVVAAVRAIADPSFQLERVLTSLHSRSPMILVAGPVAAEIGMNGGPSALGAGARANATIGRAVGLVCRNVGGARPGALNATTIGHPGAYSYCFAENEDVSPWPALHTELGYPPDASTVTAYAADAPLCLAEVARLEADVLLAMIAAAASIPGTYNALHRQELWIVLSPTHAGVLAAAGLGRGDVAAALFQRARVPADLLPVDRLVGGGLFESRDGADEHLDEWIAAGAIPVVDRADRIRVAVAGGAVGGYTALVFGSGVSVTEEVDR